MRKIFYSFRAQRLSSKCPRESEKHTTSSYRREREGYFEIMLSHQIESHIAIAGIRKWGKSELQKRDKRADGTFIYYRCPIKCFTCDIHVHTILRFHYIFISISEHYYFTVQFFSLMEKCVEFISSLDGLSREKWIALMIWHIFLNNSATFNLTWIIF